jgi:UDP-N-acetylmuramyl pentapeptide phosphotransferase/UDP-N-acetylglucosamine-1-phosphate transferase
MHALPLLVALSVAASIAPACLRALSDAGHVRPNYRDRLLPCPFGVLTLAAALLALIPLMLVQQLTSTALFYPVALPVGVYALGVLALGLVDDTLAREESSDRTPSASAEHARAPQRGWRGHGAAALHGELTTGVLKAGGSLGLALLSMSYLGLSNGRWLLATGVLVLATNAFNLLDLRPGRATKAFVLLGAGLTLGAGEARQLWALGLFAAPALVAGLYDLRERAMLGDTGANLLGALAGLWMVLTLSGTGQLIALALLLLITLYGEIRSISAFVERVPGLRALDSWGRPS